MKRRFSKILSAIVIGSVLCTPVTTKAATTSSIELGRYLENTNEVKLVLEGVNTIAKSFQFSFKLEGAELETINWSDVIKSNAKVNIKEGSDNAFDIYVTSKVDLVNEDGNLEIGTLKVTGTEGNEFNVVPNNKSNMFKLVTNNNKQQSIDTMTTVGEEKFIVGKEVEAVNPVDPVQPGDNDNNSGSNNNNSNNSNNSGNNSENDNNSNTGNNVNNDNNSEAGNEQSNSDKEVVADNNNTLESEEASKEKETSKEDKDNSSDIVSNEDETNSNSEKSKTEDKSSIAIISVVAISLIAIVTSVIVYIRKKQK